MSHEDRSHSGSHHRKHDTSTKGSEAPAKQNDALDRFASLVISRPGTTFGVAVVVTILLFGAMTGALPFQDKAFGDLISTNIDQYIPEDTEETRILNIVRENWATKVVIIFIKTGNAFDPDCTVNVTDRNVLEEISSVEGDDFYPGTNWARGDGGKFDNIEYILSLPALIKEINSSAPRMINVLQDEMATELAELFGQEVDISEDDPYVEEHGRYAIPPTQEQVDQMIAQIPYDVLRGFCADTNGDGIWDTTYSMMGAIEETPDEPQRKFVDHIIANRRIARADDGTDPHFDDPEGPRHTWMVQTGLIAIMIDITEEANRQLGETMPLAIGLVLSVIIVAHVLPGLRAEAGGEGTDLKSIAYLWRLVRAFLKRLVSVLSITGIPLACTIIWTFGIMTLTNFDQSPLVVAAIPMLVGLSVDYSLHISNRITENIGLGLTPREGVRRTLHTTGTAVLLSAVTTMIGFAALFVAPLSPIRMLGLMLIVGIGSAFLLSLTIVPCIVLLAHYRKPELTVWEKVARVPVRHDRTIGLVVLAITVISLMNLSAMTETEEGRDEDPKTMGIQSLDAIIEFGELWGQGSMSLVVLEPTPQARETRYRDSGALNDTMFLDQVSWLSENITSIERYVDVEDVSSMTIVDLFKSVALNVSWTTVEGHLPPLPGPIEDWLKPIYDPISGEVSRYYTVMTYWDLIHLSDDPEFQKRSLRIFYNSLTQEARDMLMTADYSMTLCMIRYPYTGRGLGEQIVDHINMYAENANNHQWERNGETQTATLRASRATGGQAISLIIHEAIMDTQKQTLILSLVFVFIALTLVFLHGSRKVQFVDRFKEGARYAAITMIPVASVVAWQPIIMKSVSSFEGGASLNFMTAMISSVVIGAGIDFGVHITERVREEGETVEGIQRAVQHTGQSIMEANLTTVAALSGGLAVVWFRGFFSVLLLLLLYSMFAGMILLPSVYSLIAKWKGRYETPEGDWPAPSDAGRAERAGPGGESPMPDPDADDAVWDAEMADADFHGEEDRIRRPSVEWEIGD